MPESRTLERGATLDGTYTIDALIGRGGMGAVYRATHARLPGKQVAIKVLHAELDDAEMRARFRREAEIASRLAHPNIIEIHDFNVLPDGTPYLVLEYLRGETLSARLRRGAIELRAAMTIARQIGSGLAAAHAAGVVHRDLKPGNVFVVATQVDGKETEVAKLLDFGVSKLRGARSVTSAQMMIGTPEYMAPEQARGADVDHRADVFAFGLIVYEMLGGRPAFAGDSIHQVVYRVVHEPLRPLRELAPGVPREVVDAVERACAKEPDARFASAGDFVAALTGEPLTMPKPQASAAFASMPPTLDDKRWRASDADAPETAPPTTADRPSARRDEPRAPVPRRASHARTLGFAIAGLAVAAAIVVAAVQLANRDAPPVTPLAAAAPAPIDAAVIVVPAAPPVAQPPDAGPPADSAPPPIDAAAIAKPRLPISPSSTPGDATVAQQLDDATRALASGDFAAAEHGANAALHDPDATPRQRAVAHGLHGIIACRLHQSLEAARADLRAMAGHAQLAARVITACRDAGFDLDDGTPALENAR